MAYTKALIIGLGNVVCSWTSPAVSQLPPKKLKLIMSSDVWHDYERGRYSKQQCYEKIAERFAISPEDMESTMMQARDSLCIHHDTMAFIQQIKDTHPGLKIYGMTNTPRPEQHVFDSMTQQWPVFDHIYISGNVGMRKPDLCFYKYVLEDLGLSPDAVVFVDDRQENILAAQSLGIHASLFESTGELCRQMRNILGDPVERGNNFLAAHAKRMHSVTRTGDTINDNFSQLLILELTQNLDLVESQPWDRTWNYFIGHPRFTTDAFPNDLDTTSLALTDLSTEKGLAQSIMDEMLTFVTEDGILMTYFDKSRPRVDPVVCVNVLSLFHKYGREDQVTATFDWILDILHNRTYISGTRYYSSPDVFLYCLTRLLGFIRNKYRHGQLQPPLRIRVAERIGAAGDSVSLATRILACKALGIANPRDVEYLKANQCDDGGWSVGWIYKYGSSGLEIGNRGLATALAVKAIQASIATPEQVIERKYFWSCFIDTVAAVVQRLVISFWPSKQ